MRWLPLRAARRPWATAVDRPSAEGKGAPFAEGGQATVELVAMVPLVLVVGALCWQVAVAGHAAWMSAHAARAAARADAVGADTEGAARSALPRGLERGLRVERLPRGGVKVEVHVPLLLSRWRSPLTVDATSSLGRATR